MNGRPWGVHTIRNIYPTGDVKTKAGSELVVAVATPARLTRLERLIASWWVFTGRAEAIIWPVSGEIDTVFKSQEKESNMEFHENKQIINPEKAASNVPYFVLAKQGSFFIPGIGEKVDGKWIVQWFHFPKSYNPIYNEISKEGLSVWACTPTLPEYGAHPE